jgi:hypothetical protein
VKLRVRCGRWDGESSSCGNANYGIPADSPSVFPGGSKRIWFESGESIKLQHEKGKREAAEETLKMLTKETTFSCSGGVAEVELGLADMPDKLGPAIKKSLE